MNATTMALETETVPQRPIPTAGPKLKRKRSPWVWTTLACALLIASGVFRIWQARRLEIPSGTVGKPPFALKSLSTTLGNWKILEGSERNLDPQVAQVSGCTDHLIRDYFDAETGCVITLLFGYGPAEWVYGHSPEVCFPASGFQPVADTMDREIKWTYPGLTAEVRGTSKVRSGIYDNSLSGGQGARNEAYYSVRHAGQWSPTALYKTFRKEPAMYRVLIQRRVLDTERRELDNPSEKFLTVLLPEIERRIAESSAAPAPAVTASR